MDSPAVAHASCRQLILSNGGNWQVQPKGFTRASTLGPIIDVIAAAGGSPARVFSRADLPLTLQNAPDVFVPLKDHFKLLLQAARELSDELFAARLGQNVTILHLGTYGKWVAQAPTLLGAINRANRSLSHMLQSATDLFVRIRNQEAAWSYASRDSAIDGRQQNEMLALCFMVEIAREYLGRAWDPDRVLLSGQSVHDQTGLDDLFGAPVQFHDGAGTIVFDKRLLATPRPASKTPSPDAAELGQAINVPGPGDLRETVTALVELELTERLPTVGWVAGKLGMSERSLQRELGVHGTRFSELAGIAIQRRAFDLLGRQERSVTDVAAELGYSDAAHFARAFKRWTGLSPRAWRENAQTSD